MQPWGRLSLDDRIAVNTEIRKEIKDKKNGKYSQAYPDQRADIEFAMKHGYIMEVTEF